MSERVGMAVLLSMGAATSIGAITATIIFIHRVTAVFA